MCINKVKEKDIKITVEQMTANAGEIPVIFLNLDISISFTIKRSDMPKNTNLNISKLRKLISKRT
jgi:hypothetical protein